MNQQVLQLGFRGFFNLTSSAVPRRNFRIQPLVPFRVAAMGSKRPRSSSSKSVSSVDDKILKELVSASQLSDEDVSKESAEINGVFGEHKDKKMDGLEGRSRKSKKEDSVIGNVVDIQIMRNDPERIEAMLYQELRSTMRSIGIPAKGRKSDLVSALKGYLIQKIEGDSSEVEVEQVASISVDSISAKGKVQRADSVSEVSVRQRSKRKMKQPIVEEDNIKVDAKIATRKEKVSINTEDISEISEPWTVLAHKKPKKEWIAYNPKTMRPPPLPTDTKSTKIMSWNVNGLRALLKLEGFSALELARREDFDILCLQETKLQEKDVESIKECLIHGYENSFWTCSVAKLGYSGTAIISRIKPLSVKYGLGIEDHDSEGRVVTAEFDSFYLLSIYVPNSGDGLRRLPYRITQWDPSLSSYIKDLEKKKPVILTGDLNCAHEEIDIYNPAGNKRSAGFTDEERQSFGKNFLSEGFVDTFRAQHPGVVGYTYWGYRHGGRKTNKGWRLDYFLVSESIADKVHDSYIVPDVGGSDHCPIGLVLKL